MASAYYETCLTEVYSDLELLKNQVRNRFFIRFKHKSRGLHLDRQTPQNAVLKEGNVASQGDMINFHFKLVFDGGITKEISCF